MPKIFSLSVLEKGLKQTLLSIFPISRIPQLNTNSTMGGQTITQLERINLLYL